MKAVAALMMLSAAVWAQEITIPLKGLMAT